MNIFIDGRSSSLYRGTGIGSYTNSLIYNLSNIDKKNKYLILTSNNKNSKKTNNISYDISPKNNLSFWDSVSLPIKKNNKIQIYHCPHNGIGVDFSNKKIKYITTLHDIIPKILPSIPSYSYLRAFNSSIDNIIKNSDAIITVSNFSKYDINTHYHYPLEKIFVTHIAPDKIFHKYNKDFSKKYINKKYNISSDFLLYIGGFSPRKNIFLSLNIFKEISNHHPDLKFVICGKYGFSYNAYKSKINDLGLNDKVIFTGFIPLRELPLFYSSCICFLYPSSYEGFGLPLLESMACGAPVIASDSTSIPEVVGSSALLFDLNDLNDYYNKLNEIISNKFLRESLIKKGFKKVSEYSFENTAIQTMQVYNTVSNF